MAENSCPFGIDGSIDSLIKEIALAGENAKKAMSTLSGYAIWSNLADAATSYVEQVALSMALTFIKNTVGNALEKYKAALSLIATLINTVENAKMFVYDMHVRKMENDINNRIEISSEIEKHLRWLKSFVSTEFFPDQSTSAYRKLKNAQLLIDNAEGAIKRFKNILENREIISIRNIRSADNSVSGAIDTMAKPDIDIVTQDSREALVQEYKNKYDLKVEKYKELGDRITELYKLLRVDREILNGMLGDAGIIGFDIVKAGNAVDKIKNKDFKNLDTYKKIGSKYVADSKTISDINELIRKDVEGLKDFDINMGRMDMEVTTPGVEDLYEILGKLNIEMKTDLKTTSRWKDTKIGLANIKYSAEMERVKVLIEAQNTFWEGRFEIENEANAAGTLISLLKQYPDKNEHPLESPLTDSLLDAVVSLLGGLWQEFGSRRAIIKLSESIRLIGKGISSDNQLLLKLKDYNVVEELLSKSFKNIEDIVSGFAPKTDMDAFNMKKEEIMKTYDNFKKAYASAIGIMDSIGLGKLAANLENFNFESAIDSVKNYNKDFNFKCLTDIVQPDEGVDIQNAEITEKQLLESNKNNLVESPDDLLKQHDVGIIV